MPHIVLLGTADTKLDELLFLREKILHHSSTTRITFLDVGRTPVSHPAISFSHPQLIPYSDAPGSPMTIDELQKLPRGELLETMSRLASACVQQLLTAKDSDAVHGIIAAGGSGNTSAAATVMKACPIGFPKLIFSTLASGDVAPIIGESDITLMYSVVDIAGLNSVLRGVLGNAAGAITGMAAAYETRLLRNDPSKKQVKQVLQVGVTMFGVTTPCVDAARKRLEEQGAEVYVFHATGTGGKAMERLVNEGALDAVLDITTTEVCDYLFGGNMSAGPERLRAAAERGIPCILSLGACDMVNFGARETVPEQYNERNLLVHNSMVTLMRTSREECAQIGRWIGLQLREWAKTPSLVELWIPGGGVSMIDIPDAPFYDRDADAALFDSVVAALEGSEIRTIREDRAINDEQFALSMADRLLKLARETKQS